MKSMTISFIQILSIISVAMIVGTFITVNITLSQNQKQNQETQDRIINITSSSKLLLSQQGVLLDRIIDLEGQVTDLQSEITTLKQEIIQLQNKLIESRVIIAEQQANITAES